MNVHNHTPRLLTHAHTRICTWVHIHAHTRTQTKCVNSCICTNPQFFSDWVSLLVWLQAADRLGGSHNVQVRAHECVRAHRPKIAHTNCICLRTLNTTLNFKHATQTPARTNIPTTQTFQLSSNVRMKLTKGTNLISSLTEMIRSARYFGLG